MLGIKKWKYVSCVFSFFIIVLFLVSCTPDAGRKEPLLRGKKTTHILQEHSSDTKIIVMFAIDNDGSTPIYNYRRYVVIDVENGYFLDLSRPGKIGDIFTDWAWGGPQTDKIKLYVEYKVSADTEYKLLTASSPTEEISRIRFRFLNSKDNTVAVLPAHTNDDPDTFDVIIPDDVYQASVDSDAAYIRYTIITW